MLVKRFAKRGHIESNTLFIANRTKEINGGMLTASVNNQIEQGIDIKSSGRRIL